MPPVDAPLAVASCIAVSDHDVLSGISGGGACLHLDQVDTHEAVRQQGLFKESLRHLVQQVLGALDLGCKSKIQSNSNY